MKEYSKEEIDHMDAGDAVYDLFLMLARLGLFKPSDGPYLWKLGNYRDLYIAQHRA